MTAEELQPSSPEPVVTLRSAVPLHAPGVPFRGWLARLHQSAAAARIRRDRKVAQARAKLAAGDLETEDVFAEVARRMSR